MALEDVYDETTLRVIDREQSRRAVAVVGGWRGAVVAGALHAAIAGVREVLEPPLCTPHVIEVSADPVPRPDARVRLSFVHHAPKATRAFVRW